MREMYMRKVSASLKPGGRVFIGLIILGVLFAVSLVKGYVLSPATHHRALKLKRDLIQRKIANVEAEIARIGGSRDPVRGLFVEEHPGLRSLRERLAELREMAKGVEGELRERQL
jgi:hypothetical protein